MSNPKKASAEAAESIVETLPYLRGKVLAWFRSRGAKGGTCDELEQLTNLRHQTASARVHELKEAGKLIPSGRRKTRSGRNATVWVVP